MALSNKQRIGTWTTTGDILYARTFDSGTTFWLCQQVAGTLDGEGDTFLIREPHMLTAQVGSINFYNMTATEAAALVDLFEKHVYPGETVSTTTRTPHGLGKGWPENFTVPNGYAKILFEGDANSPCYQKASSTPKSSTGNTTDTAAGGTTATWWSKNKKYVYYVGAAIGAILVFLGIRKATKKKK